MRLQFLPEVWPELFASSEWYEIQEAGVGADFLEEAYDLLDRVEASPFQFPAVRGRARRAQLRRFPYGIFFEVAGENVVVYAIMHMSRDPSAWQRRLP